MKCSSEQVAWKAREMGLVTGVACTVSAAGMDDGDIRYSTIGSDQRSGGRHFRCVDDGAAPGTQARIHRRCDFVKRSSVNYPRRQRNNASDDRHFARCLHRRTCQTLHKRINAPVIRQANDRAPNPPQFVDGKWHQQCLMENAALRRDGSART